MEALTNVSQSVSAAVYAKDLYVEVSFSQETATLLGPNCNVWLTNEHQHR